MEAYGGSTNSRRVFGWKKTKRKQHRQSVDKYGSVSSIYSYRSPSYLYGSVSSRQYPWDTYVDVQEPIYEDVMMVSGNDSCTCESPIYAELYGPKKKKKNENISDRRTNKKFIRALETRDPFSSIASRKSILECDVTAYDLVTNYLKSKGPLDSDLDDNLSDNAVEESGENTITSPPGSTISESESGIYSHIRLAGYGVRIGTSSDSTSSTQCSIASDDGIYSLPEPDYDDSDEDIPRFKDLKITSSPLLVRKRLSEKLQQPAMRAEVEETKSTARITVQPVSNKIENEKSTPTVAVRIRNSPKSLSEVKSILKKTDNVSEIYVNRLQFPIVPDKECRKKKHVHFKSSSRESLNYNEDTDNVTVTEIKNEKSNSQHHDNNGFQTVEDYLQTNKRSDFSELNGFRTITPSPKNHLTVQCINDTEFLRNAKEKTSELVVGDYPNEIRINNNNTQSNLNSKPNQQANVICIQNGNESVHSKNGNFSPTVNTDVWGTFSKNQDKNESQNISVNLEPVEKQNKLQPMDKKENKINGTQNNEVVIIPCEVQVNTSESENIQCEQFSNVIKIQNDPNNIKILMSNDDCSMENKSAEQKTEIYVSHHNTIDVYSNNSENEECLQMDIQEEKAKNHHTEEYKIVLNTAEGELDEKSDLSKQCLLKESISSSSFHSNTNISKNPDLNYHEDNVPNDINDSSQKVVSENEQVPEDANTNSAKTTGLYNIENLQHKSFFEGASKTEILSYLEDAKSRGVDDLTEEDIQSLIDIDTSSILSTTKQASPIEEVVQSTINISKDTSDDNEPLTTADIERNDSGVGTETSKPPRLRRLILPGSEEVSCADCDLPIDSSTDNQLNGHFYPLVCKKCEKKRSERKEIIAEIVDTEFKYGHDLKVIKEEFYCPMEVAGLLTKVQLRSIFLNLEELMRVNVKFAEKLKDALDIAVEQGDEDYTNVNIGKLFLESSSMVHAFETYCIRQGAASMLLANLEKEKELLRIFLRVSQMENTLLRRMNLPAFLMVPVQRVTKYPLLLNRLYKVTPYHHQDRESLKEAQQKIEFHLEHINQQTKGTGCTKIWRRFSNISVAAHRRITNGIDIGNFKLRKLALEVLRWNREEVRFVMAGKLMYAQVSDYPWMKKNRKLKYTLVHALLATLGKPNSNYRPELASEGAVLFPKNTGIRDATLLLMKEKNGRFVPIREPLHLSNCVITNGIQNGDHFEVQEYCTKESFNFKAETTSDTREWLKQLRYHAKDLGTWRRRRNALANIMINGMTRS
ncbi:rhoGEF domain-containing protein gxcJ [Centruroides vittatus]|uniref:rhoGEF domain-containing protein gxcJ n=1 Tax=Centruroides vittatus TaxID=120091 RepID=UPI00350F83FD